MSQTIRGLGRSINHIFTKKPEGYFTRKEISAIIALGMGIAMSILTFFLVERLEFSDLKKEFLLDTANYTVALRKSINENINSLHAIEGL